MTHALTELRDLRDTGSVRRFELQGVRLELPTHILQPDVLAFITSERYEADEGAAVRRTVRPGDRVLEFGAGIGLIGVLCARQGAARVVSIEADPALIPVARRTHALNGAAVELRQALVAAADGEAVFFRQPSFWASSPLDLPGGVAVPMPTVGLDGLIAELRPDVLIVDVEGGERTLFDGTALPGVREIVIEVHKPQIGLGGIARCLDRLRALGFGYDPDGSVDSVLRLSRLAAC
jgi:FkbM family methyltransferase